MSRVPRSAKVRPIAGNVAHQVFVVIATGATLGLAALATDGYIASSKHESAAAASGMSVPSSAEKCSKARSRIAAARSS